MKYRIKYTYDTGDSFGQEHDCVGYLESTWEKLDVAKDNLRRIKEHYLFYMDRERSHLSKKEEQKALQEMSKKDWFVKGHDFCLKLCVDSGTEYQICAPWCGYFESLNEVEIEPDTSDMKVSFR